MILEKYKHLFTEEELAVVRDRSFEEQEEIIVKRITESLSSKERADIVSAAFNGNEVFSKNMEHVNQLIKFIFLGK